jgi:hypothetical protein
MKGGRNSVASPILGMHYLQFNKGGKVGELNRRRDRKSRRSSYSLIRMEDER